MIERYVLTDMPTLLHVVYVVRGFFAKRLPHRRDKYVSCDKENKEMNIFCNSWLSRLWIRIKEAGWIINDQWAYSSYLYKKEKDKK